MLHSLAETYYMLGSSYVNNLHLVFFLNFAMKLLHQGKVRDVYALDSERLLIVATDRLSAYDVIFPDPIPGKGAILTALTRWWLPQLQDIVATHWSGDEQAECLALAADPDTPLDPAYRADLPQRAMIVERCKVVPFECVVRGFAFGSYLKSHPDVAPMTRFEVPLFTPSTKATEGHDETIPFEEMQAALGPLAVELRDKAIALFQFAAARCAAAGIVLVDTKFEFGHNADGALRLVDECFTPDSSRFILQADVERGVYDSFDKQIVRDYVDRIGWDRTPPAPELPPDIIAKTRARYITIQERLTGEGIT